MTKKINAYAVMLKNKRGSILAITSAIIATIALVLIPTFSAVLYQIANYDPGSIAAYYAAQTCVHEADNLQLCPQNLAASCSTVGDISAIDWTNSTDASVVCSDTGEADTVFAVGTDGKCNCTAEFIDNSVADTYSMRFTGKCSPSANGRTAEDVYSVSINKSLSGCPSCLQFCPAPGLVGTPCGPCGVDCDICCVNPGGCDAATLLCL